MAFFVVGEVLAPSTRVELMGWIFVAHGGPLDSLVRAACLSLKADESDPQSQSHDRLDWHRWKAAEMHAFWATHFFLGFFLIYTGYKALGSLRTRLISKSLARI